MSALALSRGDPETRSLALAGTAVAALAASIGASVWIAAGAANGSYLLELPTGASPHWIGGPLRGLVAPLGPSGLSAALIALVAAYLVGLACAGAISLRVALTAVALANLALTLGPSLVSTDVFGYVAYAREAARHGLNPYVSPPIVIARDPVLQYVYWKHQTSPYGPLFTILSVPLGLLPASVALWTYKAAAGAASITIALLVAALARRRGLSQSRAAIFVGLNPILLVYGVSGAHNDLLAVLLVLAAASWMMRGRESRGAGAAIAAATVKVTLGLALPYLLIGARRRGAAARGTAVALVAIGVPSLLLFGTQVFDQLHRIATDRQFDIAFSGPDRLATALGTQLDPAVRAACTGGAAVVALVMIAWALRGGDPIVAAGWAFLALMCSIASLAPWYLVWPLPLAAVARSRALRAATLLATLYLVAVHLPTLSGVPWLTPARASAVRASAARASAVRVDQLHDSRPGVGRETRPGAIHSAAPPRSSIAPRIRLLGAGGGYGFETARVERPVWAHGAHGHGGGA